MKNTQITKEQLEAVKYGDLKAKFTELGIESAWQNGVKKADLIAVALEKLDELKVNVSEQELEGKEVVDEKEKELAEAKAAEKKEKELVGSEEESEEESEVEKVVVSRETLEKNLKNINANLTHGVPGHRQFLLKQQEKIQALLDALDKKGE